MAAPQRATLERLRPRVLGPVVGLAILLAVAPSGILGLRTGGADERGAPSSAPGAPVRGIFDRDASATGFDDQASLGFTTFDTGPWPQRLDALAARHLKGFVWLGGYSNERCRFRESDRWVREHVSAIAGHPAIAGYFLDDEPLAEECPSAPAEIKIRADLIRSLDPRPPTFVVLYRVDELKRFAGTADVLAVDHYPCSIDHGCDFGKIDESIRELDRLGVRYWAVIQAHGDDWYRVPTPAELHQQFVRWRASRMEGYLVFAWRWPDGDPSSWLQNDRALQWQLAKENALPLRADRPHQNLWRGSYAAPVPRPGP
jgi:hypothetical protein